MHPSTPAPRRTGRAVGAATLATRLDFPAMTDTSGDPLYRLYGEMAALKAVVGVLLPLSTQPQVLLAVIESLEQATLETLGALPEDHPMRDGFQGTLGNYKQILRKSLDDAARAANDPE